MNLIPQKKILQKRDLFKGGYKDLNPHVFSPKWRLCSGSSIMLNVRVPLEVTLFIQNSSISRQQSNI